MVTWTQLPDVKWFVVRSFNDFVYKIEKDGIPEMVSFDHDLCLQDGDLFISMGRKDIPYYMYKEKTGLDAVKWLKEYCQKSGKPFPKYYIHSKNPNGAANIQKAIDGGAIDRLTSFKHSDIMRGFNGEKPYIYLKTSEWGTHEYVDPFPCYSHDFGLVLKEIEEIESIAPLKFLPTYHILPYETESRTNGWASPNQRWNEDRDGKILQPYIVLAGKRIPIMPTKTRYLVAHEYSHVVHYNLESKRGLKDNEFDAQYAEYRKIPKRHTYGALNWHTNVGEIIANDIRILVFNKEPEFWPHPVEHPSVVSGLKEYWEEIIKELKP